MSVPVELKTKRAELSARVQELVAEVSACQVQIAARDTVIRIYDPEWKVEAPAGKRRGRPPMAGSLKQLKLIIKGTNTRQLTLEILRKADRPVTLSECTSTFAEKHGIADDDPMVPAIGKTLTSVLAKLKADGRVRTASTMAGHEQHWEIAA